MKLSRRQVLATLAAFSLSGRAFASEANTAEALLSLVDDRKAASEMGALWLKQAQQKPNVALSSLETRLHGQGWNGETDRVILRNAMAAAVASDYRAGDVVTLGGWQVAKAQAELCALAYFAETGSLGI